jgi:hypothetical protein
MDTRYWGPSGWRLLHLISFSAVPKRASLCRFFNVLPYVLPCKYCRKSLSEYVMADPVDCALKENRLPKWLWRIHNDVNAKLRRQRIPVDDDPSFAKVRDIYEERLLAGCTRTTFEGWEFLFSVAESHPFSRQGRSSLPCPDHPSAEELAVATPLERNRWNAMTPEERMPYYEEFWRLLPEVLPFDEWRRAWTKAAAASTGVACRIECLKHLWSIRCHMERELELLNRTTYDSLCKELRTYRSGCSTSTRGKTCRRKRGATR